MSTLSIATAQFEASTDTKENRSKVKELIQRAAAVGKLVVLPENSMFSDPQKTHSGAPYSESLDGEFVTALKASAVDNHIHILCGMTETNTEDIQRPFNTLVYVNASGELVDVYRKIHLYDAFGYTESDKVTAADIDSPLVFDIDGVKIGAATCYDLRFPEVFRWIADEGADVVALPAAWAAGAAKEDHWTTLIKSRAIENTLYMVGSGQTGPSCTGQSLIVDPMGVIVASAGEVGMGVASGTVDTDRIDSVRKTNPSLKGRRFTVAPKTASA